jgi:hypothetical protein
MKKTFLTPTFIVFAALSGQCSLDSKKVNSQTSSSTNLANNSISIGTQSRPDDLKRGKDSQTQYEAIQNRIKGEYLKLKIMNLKEAVSDSENETRIWVGFGLTYSRCLVLKHLNGKQKAFYIGPNIIGSKAEMDMKGEVLITETVLDDPQSGWGELDRFLKEQGVDSPIKLSLDEQHMPDPDEQYIVVETKSGALYSMVFFSLYTETEDGQKALKVCRRMEQEFNVRMGCGNP